jgi:hypothetical protein
MDNNGNNRKNFPQQYWDYDRDWRDRDFGKGDKATSIKTADKNYKENTAGIKKYPIVLKK